MFSVKVAVTERAVVIVTVHAPVPEQAPPQPVKVEPVEAAGVRVTMVLKGYDSEQSEPQAMPAGVLVTVPVPVPLRVTVRV